jgi:phospholipase D1/2
MIIEDRTPVESRMNGQPYRASKFAASLRRQIFRKHLGLLKPQNYQVPDANFEPVSQSPNDYDFGSAEDAIVIDPLDDAFLQRWNSTARTNTEVYGKVFHPVPHDGVRTWAQYDDFYEKHFRQPDPADKEQKLPAGKYKVGHVVSEEFPGGAREVREWLSRVKGTLVEMPLLFLKDEVIAEEGMSLNAFTEELYT